MGQRPPGTRAATGCASQATNIASIRIDPRRARVTCGVKLAVKSDGPLKVHLAGCPGRD